MYDQQAEYAKRSPKGAEGYSFTCESSVTLRDVTWACAGVTRASVASAASPTCDTTGTHLVALASARNQTAGQFDIYLYDLDQLGFHLLRNLNVAGSSDVSPALAGDGQALAFVTNRAGGAGGTDIMIYD